MLRLAIEALLCYYYAQITGYLSGPSPHIKSGVVSALSVLIYSDPNVCITMPEVVPSVMELLHSKAIEVIKVSSPQPLYMIKFIFKNHYVDEVHYLNCTGCFGLCEGIGIMSSCN